MPLTILRHFGVAMMAVSVLFGGLLSPTPVGAAEKYIPQELINPVDPIDSADCHYFTETGHNLCGGLLEYWNTHGGLEILGYPITEATDQLLEVNGEWIQLWVQYTERARLEVHSADNGEFVQLGHLGRLAFELSSLPEEIANPVEDPKDANVLHFSETGHTLAGHFRKFWEQNGGLEIFGFPITEPTHETIVIDGVETKLWVQYFERWRFELHGPEGSEYVLGGHYGRIALEHYSNMYSDGSPPSNQPPGEDPPVAAPPVEPGFCTYLGTDHHGPIPYQPWSPEGEWRIVYFWSNWPDLQTPIGVQYIFVLEPGQNPPLKGGGSVSTYTGDNCDKFVMEEQQRIVANPNDGLIGKNLAQIDEMGYIAH